MASLIEKTNTTAKFLDEAAVKSAIANLRKEGSDCDYVVVGYEDPTTLKLISTGTGGAAAVNEYLVEGECRYALIRNNFLYVQPGKEINTIKFVYVYFRSDSLPIKYKMKIGLYEKQVNDLFSPYHTDLQISSTKELSEEIITKKLQKVSGTADYTSDRKDKDSTNMHVGSAGYVGGKALSTKETTKVHEKVATGAPLSFSNPEEPGLTFGLVRSDTHDNNWCIFGYADASDKKNLVVKGTGSGGLAEMKEHFEKDNVNYCLYRLIEEIDGKTKAVKFCYIVSIPSGINPMKRGAVTTHKGFVNAAFSPYHGSVDIEDPKELNDEGMLKAVSSLKKSDVKAR